MSSKLQDTRLIAQNRRARYDYFIEETLEAGISLLGTEVKSLRNSQANINDAYCDVDDDSLMLINSYIPEYEKASNFNHSARRTRRLLLHKKQIKKIIGKLKTKGLSVVPLRLYFNSRNIAKLEIAIVKGKKEYDKRESIKQEEWNRRKARILNCK